MGVFFFYGDEEYLINKELKKYRDKLDTNFSEMNYCAYDRLSYTDLVSVLRTQPMMFGKMMIVIKTAGLFSSGNKTESLLSASLEDSQLKEIETALEGNIENNNEMVDIFFMEIYQRDDKKKKPDSRRKIFKILSKYTTKAFEAIPKYKTAELSIIIQQMAKEKKLKIDQSVIEELISIKGNNLEAFDIELDKLEVYAHPEKTITKKMVSEICSATVDIFNLTDYLMEGHKGKALEELKKLLITKHPLQIIALLQTMLKQWIFMKLNAGKMSNKEIGDKLGRMHEYRVKLSLEKMRKVQLKTLVDLKTNITEAEYKIKTGQVFSPEEELENAIIR